MVEYRKIKHKTKGDKKMRYMKVNKKNNRNNHDWNRVCKELHFYATKIEKIDIGYRVATAGLNSEKVRKLRLHWDNIVPIKKTNNSIYTQYELIITHKKYTTHNDFFRKVENLVNERLEEMCVSSLYE